MNKAALRRSLLQHRQALSIDQWQTQSQQICDRLCSTPQFIQAQTVLAYFSTRQEPDLSLLLTLDKTWGFPRCVSKDLSWHCWLPGDELEKGAFGIAEPSIDSPQISPEQVDLILVPAVACDARGYRLGYGGGYYDRLLSSPQWKGKPTIGIVFEAGRVAQLPIEPWDQPLQAVCTEAGFFPAIGQYGYDGWAIRATALTQTERLLIFTRYPEPGKTKTRLIPALGAERAALLHRQMAEWTIAQVRSNRSIGLRHNIGLRRNIEVWFTGGSVAQMQAWLGKELDYQPQGTGDLGARLTAAFRAAFDLGINRVTAIGTDCPQLDSEILDRAFRSLHSHDLVLGGATDGGYYLIGMRRFLPELFAGIDWGTEKVLQQTRSIAQMLELSIADLPILTDVDRPEDLGVWERVVRSP